jgi:hypothetical protein
MPRRPVVRQNVKLPVRKPRNPVQRALLDRTLTVGTGQHRKSTGAKRQAAKAELREVIRKSVP